MAFVTFERMLFLLLLAFFFFWSVFYYLFAIEKPKLYYNRNSKISNFLVKECKELNSYYYPLFLCINGHINNFIGLALWSIPVLNWERTLNIELHDGGLVTVDIIGFKENLNDSRPVIFILHGLTGDSSDFTRYAKDALARGYRVACMNRRGHGKAILRNKILPATSRFEDVKASVDKIKSMAPNAPIFAIGFSAGSGYLSSYMSMEDPATNPLSAAAFVRYASHLQQNFWFSK